MSSEVQSSSTRARRDSLSTGDELGTDGKRRNRARSMKLRARDLTCNLHLDTDGRILESEPYSGGGWVDTYG